MVFWSSSLKNVMEKGEIFVKENVFYVYFTIRNMKENKI